MSARQRKYLLFCKLSLWMQLPKKQFPHEWRNADSRCKRFIGKIFDIVCFFLTGLTGNPCNSQMWQTQQHQMYSSSSSSNSNSQVYQSPLRSTPPATMSSPTRPRRAKSCTRPGTYWGFPQVTSKREPPTRTVRTGQAPRTRAPVALVTPSNRAPGSGISTGARMGSFDIRRRELPI